MLNSTNIIIMGKKKETNPERSNNTKKAIVNVLLGVVTIVVGILRQKKYKIKIERDKSYT